MTQTIFVIRPEPGFSATWRQGRALGIDMAGEPLFAIEPVAWDLPDLAGIDGLLIGSANAIRQAGDQLKELLALPVYAVGETTARVAHSAGFKVHVCGTGGLQNLLDTLDGQSLRLLRLGADDRVELAPPGGITIIDRVIYRSPPLAMSEQFSSLLEGGGVVLLHSARAASHFSEQCDAHGVDRGRLAIAALAPRVAIAASGQGHAGWSSVRTALAPDDAALLALARYMCNSS